MPGGLGLWAHGRGGRCSSEDHPSSGSAHPQCSPSAGPAWSSHNPLSNALLPSQRSQLPHKQTVNIRPPIGWPACHCDVSLSQCQDRVMSGEVGCTAFHAGDHARQGMLSLKRQAQQAHLGSSGVHSRATGTWFQMLPTSSISDRSSTSLPGAISRPMSPVWPQGYLRPHHQTH